MQTSAFEILLSENHLSLEDQEKTLQNVKQRYEELQQDYRDAKQDHEFRRRQGLLSVGSTDAIFDESKEVEGDLHRLNMKLDDLDHRVQENTKVKTYRKPFSGSPMKADHDLGLNSLTTGANNDPGQPRRQLSPRRPPSVGSNAGSPGEIDEKLHRLDKEYNSLMDRYRMLKQLKRTPERDEEVSGLLGVSDWSLWPFSKTKEYLTDYLQYKFFLKCDPRERAGRNLLICRKLP